MTMTSTEGSEPAPPGSRACASPGAISTFVLLDTDGHIGHASRGVGDLLDAPGAALPGSQLETWLVRETITVPESTTEVSVWRRSDGTRVTARATPLPTGAQHAWIVSLEGEASRPGTEQQRPPDGGPLGALASRIGEGVYHLSLRPTPRIAYVNPTLERISGFTSTRLRSDEGLVRRQLHPDDRDLLRLLRAGRLDPTRPIELRWRHPSGIWRHLLVREDRIQAVDGRPELAVGIVSDLTQDHDVRTALDAASTREREARALLLHLEDLRENFLRSVSHELRTPLTAILGYVEMLTADPSPLDAARRQQVLQRLRHSAGRLDRQLLDLLEARGVDDGGVATATGSTGTHRRSTDLTGLCADVIDRRRCTTHQFVLVGGPVVAAVDPVKVDRIVDSLLDNAVRHTPAGTTVVVDVRREDTGRAAVLTVADDGPGVPEVLASHLFGPFVQGREALRSPTPGLGLGLALVSRFAESHGGHAWAEAAPGGGLAVRVRLPGLVLPRPGAPTVRDLEDVPG